MYYNRIPKEVIGAVYNFLPVEDRLPFLTAHRSHPRIALNRIVRAFNRGKLQINQFLRLFKEDETTLFDVVSCLALDKPRMRVTVLCHAVNHQQFKLYNHLLNDELTQLTGSEVEILLLAATDVRPPWRASEEEEAASERRKCEKVVTQFLTHPKLAPRMDYLVKFTELDYFSYRNRRVKVIMPVWCAVLRYTAQNAQFALWDSVLDKRTAFSGSEVRTLLKVATEALCYGRCNKKKEKSFDHRKHEILGRFATDPRLIPHLMVPFPGFEKENQAFNKLISWCRKNGKGGRDILSTLAYSERMPIYTRFGLAWAVRDHLLTHALLSDHAESLKPVFGEYLVGAAKKGNLAMREAQKNPKFDRRIFQVLSLDSCNMQ